MMNSHQVIEERIRALRQLSITQPALQQEALLHGLSQLDGHDPELCRRAMELCRPEMNRMQPEPENGWLNALREHLSANLFPDETHPASPLSEAETFFLAVLELLFQFFDGEADPLTDLLTFDKAALEQSRVKREYIRFQSAIQEFHVLALLRMLREANEHDLASHVIGVHNLALHTAILAVEAGLKVDLPLVSGAALGHDIGKFGCRGEESARTPYLHYYYTWQWFSENGMENIGHVAANHSTWDLEFENLPIESLLLIYADFRVRGIRRGAQREKISIYSLSESYDMIFSKLYDMTPQKQKRYQTVYLKLRDFERLLTSYGVPTDMTREEIVPMPQKDAAILTTEEALQALRSMTLSGSMKLMRTISIDPLFAQLLEQAKSEKNLHRIRTYLSLFKEYNTYMSKANKKKLLVLLYELLTHPDGDVRRMAGEIMGDILSNSGPKYRKERPRGAHDSAIMTPTMMALLDESVELWEQYMQLCLHPDRKNSPKHAMRIANSLKTICQSLFASCEAKDAPRLVEPLLQALYDAEGTTQFALVDALCYVPVRYLSEEHCRNLLPVLQRMLQSGETSQQLIALYCLKHLQQIPAQEPAVRNLAENLSCTGEHALVLTYLQWRILGKGTPHLSDTDISALYLSNLKNAVHWTVKLAQISLLYRDALAHSQNLFHTALHFSNLLCVSEHLPVRVAAGERLLKIAPLLSVDQINEISCDLLRELETGQEQIIRFIPPYIGRFICRLPEKELLEAVDGLESMVRGASGRTACVSLQAIGELIVSLQESSGEIVGRLLGILMTGVSHYDESVHQTALYVLGHDIFGSSRLSLAMRGQMLMRLHKKLLTLLSEPRESRLTMFNTAAMLNHLYRLIVSYEVEVGEFQFPKERPVAFFPGTFDPFSVGHKQIVSRIRDIGFEVYLAVDEFSWSKKTLPKLLRRQIVSISVADQGDTYLFPDDIPINIAMPQDLARLKELFPGREIYLVAGSDVIHNASAYRNPQPGAAADYNHIVFSRGEGTAADGRSFGDIIRGKLQVLTLPTFYETVSSTRIREYVDRGLDISMLVDPVVQSFIYENGLYIREPESKNVLSQQELQFRLYSSEAQGLPDALNWELTARYEPLAVTLQTKAELQGWAAGYTVSTRNLYDVLGSADAANSVRQHVSGRLFMVDSVQMTDGVFSAEHCRMLLNELLARSLDFDYNYALCRCGRDEEALRSALLQLGFVPVQSCDTIYYVDLRAPVMLLQDVLLTIKQPLHDNETVRNAVLKTRPRLRAGLNQMFPGKLLLCFDSELLNQSLMERVQRLNGVHQLPKDVRLGASMCVPYGKILSDVVVPHTVTKTLHVEKRFHPDLQHFEIVEFPGYSPLRNQVRMLKSFQRPVLLVDDLLHNGYRLEKLDKVFREEGFEPEKIVVAILSGRGRDIMRQQGRKVECEYFIPNLHYWVTESLLYPFIGGDSVEGTRSQKRMLPSINLLLPYYYPNYFREATESAVRELSAAALQNALQIMQALEYAHQQQFSTTLTIGRLGEALYRPRLPESGSCMLHDVSLPASAYLQDSLLQLERICRRERSGE